MTIARIDGRIVLTGACPIEEAEHLLNLLQEPGRQPIVLEGCGRLSTAIVQLLLASRRAVTGVPADPFTRDHLLPSLLRAGAASALDATAKVV